MNDVHEICGRIVSCRGIIIRTNFYNYRNNETTAARHVDTPCRAA